MKKHNIEIVKQLRSNITPMTERDLNEWLETNLEASDISATVASGFDKRGFIAHDVILSDNYGSPRRIIVPALSHNFTFDSDRIYDRYNILSPRHRIGSKNMHVVKHDFGHILVSYGTMICFYHFDKNTVFFKRNAFHHSITTSKHIHIFLTDFVKTDAIKIFAKTRYIL